jgi:heme-degrading monooxygenase HmoA/uncharacterized protein YjiS (DUF1127 family)
MKQYIFLCAMPIARQGRCRAAATIIQVAAERVAEVFAACWHAYARRRERTAAVRELRALDDRSLRDIGINRSEIESVVYGRDTTRLRGRDDPAADCRRAETRPSRTTALGSRKPTEKIANPATTNRTQMRKAAAMIAVIFESWPTNAQKYIDMGEALRSHLDTLDGFISIERFRSVSDPAKLVALSFWRNEAAVEAWRNNEVHRLIQAKSRQDVFRDYRLRVATVLRDYGMFERDQAPQDSRVAHEQR